MRISLGPFGSSSHRSVDKPASIKTRQRQKRFLASVCVLASFSQLLSFDGFFEFTMPNTHAFRRMLTSRFLSRPLPDGGCEWLAPDQLNATYDPPRTMLVSYPGSGKRLVWRMIEAFTGFRTGDDWDLSEEGDNVLAMKTSYPHPEGVWTWGARFHDASIVLLIRNPRWAIPSYHTMRWELDYPTNYTESYAHRPDTYTARPSQAEWEAWRGETWPNGNTPKGNFAREIDLWGWFIDFWMNDGQRRNDGNGNPVQDYHCRKSSGHMANCIPDIVISFEDMYSADRGLSTVEKLMDILELNQNPGGQSMPVVARGARRCVFGETTGKRGTEAQWDNSGRDGHGPDSSEYSFTWLQLQYTRDELLRLIGVYTNTTLGWDTDPVAQDLVVHLYRYLGEIEDEIDSIYPYTWWPTSAPTVTPSSSPSAHPTPGECDACAEGWTYSFDNDSIRIAVEEYFSDRNAAIEKYGRINCWNTIGVTDMSGLFRSRTFFNDDISCWSTKFVTTMARMFWSTRFNQPIGTWDTHSLQDMTDMFRASWFNQDISTWDVGSVTTLYRTFLSSRFNQDISAWDVRNVQVMLQVFNKASNFNQNLCAWGEKAESIPRNFETNNMFTATLCPDYEVQVDLAADPPGPFCHACV